MALEPPECWEEALRMVPGVDSHAIQVVIGLTNDGDRGYFEACRILHHIIKYSWSGGTYRRGASGWLIGTVNEARAAIKIPEEWQGLYAHHRSSGAASSSGCNGTGKGGPPGLKTQVPELLEDFADEL